MRKYAYLKEPLQRDNYSVYKIMLYEAEEGFYLFEYDSPAALMSCNDLCYQSLEELHEDWDDLIDKVGWLEMEDPLPDCQHDAFMPIRVKGRESGNPEWGSYEALIDGQWVEYKL